MLSKYRHLKRSIRVGLWLLHWVSGAGAQSLTPANRDSRHIGTPDESGHYNYRSRLGEQVIRNAAGEEVARCVPPRESWHRPRCTTWRRELGLRWDPMAQMNANSLQRYRQAIARLPVDPFVEASTDGRARHYIYRAGARTQMTCDGSQTQCVLSRVRRNGQVEESLDGGRTWQRVDARLDPVARERHRRALRGLPEMRPPPPATTSP